ncbi:hypothetical protein [Naasia lichenicola]|uniref:Uncharacterized protein n=1 Tax=Naasia lichenicola TaxID=2565933 RepID=A0A4S4FQ24_9MICO|nr:hypothetical protein [Naasia lichenicola]THG30695.1 hypothetical protein E6C64_08625 [Naasia lichenicola]THG31932.1 hypothetical protein E6C64_07770 [Naasia lichenicola]
MSQLTKRGKPRQRSAPITRSRFHAVRRDIAEWKRAGEYNAARLASALGLSVESLNSIRRAKSWKDFEKSKADRLAKKVAKEQLRAPHIHHQEELPLETKGSLLDRTAARKLIDEGLSEVRASVKSSNRAVGSLENEVNDFSDYIRNRMNTVEKRIERRVRFLYRGVLVLAVLLLVASIVIAWASTSWKP